MRRRKNRDVREGEKRGYVKESDQAREWERGRGLVRRESGSEGKEGEKKENRECERGGGGMGGERGICNRRVLDNWGEFSLSHL